MFRRAVANAELRNYDLAINDLKIVLKLDPTNKAAALKLKVYRRTKYKNCNRYFNIIFYFRAKPVKPSMLFICRLLMPIDKNQIYKWAMR